MQRFVSLFFALYSACACFAVQPPKGLSTAPLMAVEDIHASNLKLETAEDGTRFISLRLRLDGAPAVRVYITGMQLAADQKLLISNPSGTQVHGPFEIAGPTQTGEFWSEAVEGSDVIVELQTGPEGAADLPFKIEAIEAAELADVQPARPAQLRETVDSFYRGEAITHEVVEGMAVYEGDILLGRADELVRAQGSSKDRVRSAVGITGKSYRWANGTIPYVISSTLPSPARVTDAVAHWNQVMAGTVQLIPRTNETAYVSFNRAASSGTCTSYIGKTFSGAQPIEVGDSCSKGNVIHEIGHAWGLWHEHTREDRNTYVTINLANIQSGQSYNFTQNISSGDDLGAYDFNSIMHYGATAFSSNGLPTIVTIPAGISIGQRNGLSTGDIAGIKALYPSSGPSTPVNIAITVTANPIGATVSVDGTNYQTPASFTWTAGSVHTIAGVNTSTSSTRTTFAAWSDGGAQSHSVTASTTVTTFKVDYALAYSVKAVAIPAGSVVASPASPDTFYVNGSSVALRATTPIGYCFTGWTGFVSGTPMQTSIVANRAYDVQANFQSGSVTLTASTQATVAAGGTYSTGVTANSGCLWSAASTVSWIKIISTPSGSGSSTINFTVDPNTTGLARSGTITVDGQTLSVTQPASDSTSLSAPVGITSTPRTATLSLGGTLQITATVSNTTNTLVKWYVNSVLGGNATVGTITQAGFYTAPLASPGSTISIAAVSAADPAKRAYTDVSLGSNSEPPVITPVPTPTMPVVVTSTPRTATLGLGGTLQITATVSNTTNTLVKWYVNSVLGGNATVGTISQTGLYTAPTTFLGTTISIAAVSAADSTKRGYTDVTLVP